MSEESPYAGHTAIVFGSTSGIGAATALLLAQRGAAVTVVGRREKEGTATAERCAAAGVAAQFVRADVTDDSQVASAVAAAVDAHGPLTMAVNSAGTDVSAPFTELTDTDFDTLFSINTAGLWRCVKHEIEAMVQTGHGSIVNVNSVASLLPVLGNSLYGASKNAVTGITQSAAYEYAAAGIRVNETAPGTTRTQVLDDFLNQTTGEKVTAEQLARCVALGYLSQPRQQATAISFLLSDEASFITGVTLPVDGGMKLLTRAVATPTGAAPETPGDRVGRERASG
jgi:A-factor type gamma-butyrolactone 1'-reductase (1S-forming)